MAHVIRSRIGTPLVLLGLLLSLSAGRAWAQQCLGDCDSNGSAGSGDLTKIITIILNCPCGGSALGGDPAGCGAAPGGCAAADRSGNGCITAGELTGVIANILQYPDTGCPPSATPTNTPPTQPSFTPPTIVVNTPTPTITPTVPTPPTATNTPLPTATSTSPPGATATPTNTSPPTTTACGNGVVDQGEDCDPGGTCIGGTNAGTACTKEADCVGDGVCLSGPNGFRVCQGPADCPGSSCVHCKVMGTAACAANCTSQTDVPFPLVTGKTASGQLVPGTSGAAVHSAGFPPLLTLPLSGTQTLTIGKLKDGEIPVIIKGSNVSLPQIKVGVLACACTRSVVQQTCGGVLTEHDGTLAIDCTPGWIPGTCSVATTQVCYNTGDCPSGQSCNIPDPCAGKKPCTFVHGPGNSATGTIGCNGLDNVNLKFFQDAGGHPQPPPPTPPEGAGIPQLTLGDACSCTTNGDCPSGTCDSAGRCTCGTADDCPGGAAAAICLCPSGAASCPPPAAAGACLYDPCETNANCPAPLTCEAGPPGSAVIVNSTAIGQVQPPPNLANPCAVPTKTPAPAYGPDHIFCTDDDPQSARGMPQTLPAVTGGATGLVINLNPDPIYIETPGQPSPTPQPTKNVGPFSVIGAPFNCTGLLTPGVPPQTPTATVGAGTRTPTFGPTPTMGPYATGAGIAGAFGALNQPTVGTIVVTNVQFSR